MNKLIAATIIAATIFASACATTGRSLPVDSTSSGMAPTFDPRLAQSTDADAVKPWFPTLASNAVLPSAARYQRELSTTADRFALAVRVCVAPDGKVASVDIKHPSGIAALDRAAARDIADWQFESFTAPAHIRVCKQLGLAYEPTAETSPWAIRLVRTSGL
jgi:TonB family protein